MVLYFRGHNAIIEYSFIHLSSMAQSIKQQVIELLLKASALAGQVGITNILQPDLIKEMMLAEILGHQLITTKRDADAHAIDNENEKYEYLTCKEGGSFQFDRMYSEPESKRKKSLERITRNAKIYFAVFYANNQLKCKIIYELNPDDVLGEAETQLDNSGNQISHIAFSIRYVSRHEKVKIAYEHQD